MPVSDSILTYVYFKIEYVEYALGAGVAFEQNLSCETPSHWYGRLFRRQPRRNLVSTIAAMIFGSM